MEKTDKPDFKVLADAEYQFNTLTSYSRVPMESVIETRRLAFINGCNMIWHCYVEPRNEQMTALQSRIAELEELVDTMKKGIIKGKSLYANIKWDDEELTPYMKLEAENEALRKKIENFHQYCDRNGDTEDMKTAFLGCFKGPGK